MSEHPVVTSSRADREEWNAFVASRPDADGYHRWEWGRVIERAFGHPTEFLMARRDGVTTGVLPLVLFRSRLFGRFAVSLPFLNYGGVLAADEQSAQALVDAAADSARTWGASHVELRHRVRRFAELPSRSHKVAMLKPLASTVDATWRELDGTVRNRVRKAEKSGLLVESGGPALLDRFYDVFAENMRNLGTPVYPKRFFEEVCAAFPHDTRVFVVTADRRPISACITYACRDTLQVPWVCSLRAFRPLAPNNLLYWRVAQYAVERGSTTLDFGRSSPDDTVYEFKRRWGAKAEPLYWEYRLLTRADVPDQGPRNPRFRLAIAAWKRLPLRVTNAIGPAIVRGFPG